MSFPCLCSTCVSLTHTYTVTSHTSNARLSSLYCTTSMKFPAKDSKRYAESIWDWIWSLEHNLRDRDMISRPMLTIQTHMHHLDAKSFAEEHTLLSTLNTRPRDSTHTPDDIIKSGIPHEHAEQGTVCIFGKALGHCVGESQENTFSSHFKAYFRTMKRFYIVTLAFQDD